MKTFYSVKFKTQILQEYLNGPLNSNEVAEKYDVPAPTVQAWGRWVKVHGFENLQPSVKKRFYSIELASKVLEYLETGAITVKEIADAVDVPQDMIYKWDRQFKQGGIKEVRRHLKGESQMKNAKKNNSSKRKKSASERRIAELEAELSDAKMDIAILKKLPPRLENSQTEKRPK
ncbi:helix-turn-helix domain-containing protein [Secundilactobacillus folii]|nr:helix-turn-helix domain-containing protein [Secundilactobacillus folii]